MIKSIAIAIALSAFALGAQAQTPETPELPAVSSVRSDKSILLIPGRELTLAWKVGAPPTEVSERPAPPRFISEVPSDADLETWQPVRIPSDITKAKPGEVTFTLWVDDKGAILVASSGQTEPIFYMANIIIRRDGKLLSSPTTTCAVPPGRVSGETWPYVIEAIHIVGMGVIPADMCYDHRARKGYKAGEQPPSTTAQ